MNFKKKMKMKKLEVIRREIHFKFKQMKADDIFK